MGTEGLIFFFNGKEVETKENEWRGKNGTSEWVRDEDRNGHEKSFTFLSTLWRGMWLDFATASLFIDYSAFRRNWSHTWDGPEEKRKRPKASDRSS